jgi:hypothetical protein
MSCGLPEAMRRDICRRSEQHPREWPTPPPTLTADRTIRRDTLTPAEQFARDQRAGAVQTWVPLLSPGRPVRWTR